MGAWLHECMVAWLHGCMVCAQFMHVWKKPIDSIFGKGQQRGQARGAINWFISEGRGGRKKHMLTDVSVLLPLWFPHVPFEVFLHVLDLSLHKFIQNLQDDG
jgi:hypothetical protein